MVHEDRGQAGQWQGGDFVLAEPAADEGVRLCMACSRLRRCRLGLQAERLENGIVTTDLVCSRDDEGGPRVAHGGWVAGVLDELVGHVPILHNQLTVTGTLTVRFVKPVPIEQQLRGRAWLVRKERRKWFVEATLELASNGVELARAEAVMVERDAQHFERHRQWLEEQAQDQGSEDDSADRRAQSDHG